MDSEKGNRVFARGHNVPPPPLPWFLEPKKSLVWIGLINVKEDYMCMCKVLLFEISSYVLSPTDLFFWKAKYCSDSPMHFSHRATTPTHSHTTQTV